MFSDLRLGDLNYLLSVKPTPQRQGHDGLLLIAKQTFTLLANSRLISTLKRQSQTLKSHSEKWLWDIKMDDYTKPNAKRSKAKASKANQPFFR